MSDSSLSVSGEDRDCPRHVRIQSDLDVAVFAVSSVVDTQDLVCAASMPIGESGEDEETGDTQSAVQMGGQILNHHKRAKNNVSSRFSIPMHRQECADSECAVNGLPI